MDKRDTKNLKKRYLIWLYKTTREALDRIERKFTQLDIDRFILEELKTLDTRKEAQTFIEEFKAYIRNKEKEGLSLTFEKGRGKPRKDYYFLVIKLKAVEKAIITKLGRPTLKEIKAMYEKEMQERILKSVEH